MARSLLGMRYGSGQRGQAYAEWQNSGGEDEYNKALALKQSGNDRFNVRSLPGGTLGQSFIDSAVGVAGSLDDYAGGVTGIGDWANDYVQSQEMNMGQKPGASLSWDYIVNGLPRDIGNVTGSMAGLALPVAIGTIAAPYLGVGATAAALGGAMVGAGLESMSEGGSKLRESLENGDSLDVAQDKANTVAGKNFALLAPTNALGVGIGKKIVNGVKNAFKAGRTIKAAEAMANAPSRMSRLSDVAKGAGWAGAGVLNEGAQEAIQQGIQDSVEPDKEYGYLPWNWNDEQWSQFKDTLAPMAVLSATGGGARFGARKIGQWLGPEGLAPDLDIDTAPTFNIPRTANYNISDEVSDRNLAQSTESKLRLLDQAYYDEYGEHLNVTSMKRHWGTNSKHESGSAFDVADAGLEGTPERRRFLEAKASEIGLKPLDEYENPSDGATGGHMHFSDDGTALNADTSFNGWSGNSDMDSLINTYAEQYGVDPALLAAVAEQESGFNQDVQSKAGAIGTMQLMPDTAKGLGVDPTDMAGNIEGGAKYLSQLMQQFGGDVHKALEAYNGGPGNVGIAQTMKYADEVLERYNKFAGKKAGTFSWNGSPAEVATTEDYNKLFADNGFAKTDTATNFLENLRMFSQDVEQSENKQVQQDSKKAEQALNSNDENIIQQTAESLGFNQQDKATAKQAESPMPIQDIATHVKNNGWVEFGSKANADEFAKSDIAKGMERYSNTGFAVKGYNPYAAPKASIEQSQAQRPAEVQEPAPAKPTPEQAQSAQPMQEQTVQQKEQVPQGNVLNSKEIDDLNTLMQDIPQDAQQKIQDMFSAKNYDGIRSMIRSYMAESASRDDIESAREVARILMGNPKAMHSNTGSSFSPNRLNDILANGSLSDINRMNNALASRLRENGENPYQVLKAASNAKIEQANAKKESVRANVNAYLGSLSGDKFMQQSRKNTLNGKCNYKGKPMTKAERVEEMLANGEYFRQHGDEYMGVTSNGTFKATKGEYRYFEYLKQRNENQNHPNLPAQWKEPTTEGEVQNAPEAEENIEQPYNPNQLEAPAIESEHLSSGEFLQTLNPTERGFMQYLDDVFDNVKLGFNDVMEYLHSKRDKIFDKRMEYVISKGVEGLSGAFYADGGKMVLNEVPSQEVQSAWATLLGMRKNFGASLANAPEEYKNEYLRVEKIVKDYLRPTITEQCKRNESYRRLSYAITGLEQIADKANEYERRVSEEGRRSGAKSYRDVSAEERQAVEGSATAWAGVLQNNVKPSSRPKQEAKPVDKSRQLNPPAEITEKNINSYGSKPVQQEEKPADTAEENAPAYGSDVAENVARMASGGNREAWIVSNKTLNRTSESKNIEPKTQAKQQDSSSMRKELIEQAAANEDTWVNSKKSELHLEDDNDTVVKLTPQELKYYHDLLKKGVVGKPELYKKAPEYVGEMDDNVEMSKEQKQIYDENNGDRDVPNSDSESIEQEENVNVKDKSEIALGDTVEVRTDDGKKIKARYALIPADKLIASNKADDTLSKNEAYPQDLQPRDRQRTAMRLQVDSMANSLRPEDLADSRNPNQGAPIVRDDMTVLNGNGRTLAVQRAYQNGKAEEYKQYLMDNAEQLGLDKSQVAAMVKDEQPILVRVVDDLSEGDTQSVISSTTGGQRMGATEQAKSDAKKIKANTLRKYSEDNKGNDFLGDVLNDIVPADERNAYMTKDGKINKDGLARAERALFARAYGDESLMEDFGENLTEEARNMTNALKANAPAIAKLQQKIKDGNAHDIGLQKNLVEAVKAIKSAAEQNKPAQSIWEEQTMFEEATYSPETIEIAKVLHDLRRSGRKLTAFIGKLAGLNEQHGNPKDEDLFAGEELAEPSLLNDIPIANEYADELTRAKYSRDAENQLDNQGKKAENEIVSRYDDLPDEYKAIVDEAVERRTNALLDRVVNSVSEKFSENFTAEDAKLGVSVLVEDKGRKAIVLHDLMVNANQYVAHPSNYREVLHNLLPGFSIDNKTREELVEAYNTFKKIAEEMLEYGSYTYSELCRRLSDGAGRNARPSTRTGIDREAAENRAFQRSPEKIKAITELFKKQETKKLRIPKHPHEEQNSRDVSAFSFGENPLSEQALKAKAEFETPLDKLEKVSRERLHKTEQRIQDFGKRIGVPVHFVRHPDKGYRGVCIHNGGIYINLNSNVPARRIFMHEFTHWLKASGEDNHKIFTALASVIETKQGTFNEIRMNDYRRRLYGGEEMSDSQIIEEIVADAMSNSESAEQIMRAIERYNPDMNVSLWSKIKALWDKFCEAVGFRQNVSAHNQPELYPAEQTGKLRQGLNNRELANFNTTLNNLMRKIKDSEGNNVFTMDGTRLTIQGKPFEDVVKVQSVDDYRPTVRRLEPAMMFSRDKNADVTDIKNNLNTANKNLNKSLGGEITWKDELAYKLTRGAFGKTKKLDNLMVKTHKDMEYDRLVAQGKDPAMYKEVGWLQKVFTSPRRIANRVPLLMPIVKSAVRATERQERLRGEFNEGMNEIMRTLGWNESPFKRNDKKMRERQDTLQRILLAGDLARTVFTVAQLKKCGADQQVIKAYKQMRELLNKAWKLANDIKEQNKYTTENFASEGMAEARLKDLQKENPFVEKVRTQSGANGEVVITFRTPNIRHINKLHVSKTELDALKNNKNVHVNEVELTERDANDSNLDTYLVSYVEKNRPMGKIEGYIPHLFNGYNLVVADKDGNVKFGKDGLPMVISTHRSISEAVKEGSRLAEKNSKVNFMVQPQMNEFMGSAEQAAVLGDYSYSKVMSQIANGMNISLADAKKLTEGGLAMKSRGRFLGYTMQRKGVTGYEKNVYKATQMYFNQVARYVALDPFKRDAINYYNRTWGAFDDSKVIARSINAAFAHRYINDINGVPTGVERNLNKIIQQGIIPFIPFVTEEAASGRPALWVTRAMTYPMTIAKLGILNMSSALLNLTQLVNLYGAMGEKTMSPEAYKRLLKQGFVGSMKAMRNKNSAEYKLLFDEMGLKYQIGIDVASGYSNTEVGGIAGLAGKFNRLAGGSMYLFKQSDVFTKGVTMLTAYHKALAEGKSKEEAIEYAKEVNTKVNFDYSTADAPELFRALGPIGAVLLQFQKYPVKQLELFKDIFDDGRSQGLNRKRSLMRLAKYMTPYMAMSGIMGVPFVSLIGGIANLFGGDDFDWDEWIKQHMIEEFGEDSLIAQSILYGGGAMFGFNVGSRVGVGDFGGISSQESTAAEMLAGKSTLLSTFMSMKRQIGYGNYVEALKSLSPSVGNIAIGLKGEVHTTRGRMKYQYQNAYERALRMIGFNPVNESLAGDLASIEYAKQNDEKHEKEKAVDAFIDEPTNENARRLQELGVTPKTIQNEVARRTMNTHDLNKLKEQEKKEKEAKSKNKKKEKQYTANDYLKEMK